MKLNHLHVIFILFLFSCQDSNHLVVFTPVTIENKNSQIEPDFYKNLQVVLDIYNVNYHVKDGKIYVSEEIYSDKELMMNYTNKARNSEWLNNNLQYDN